MHRLFKHHLTCLHFISAKRNTDSLVILVTRLLAGRLWNRGLIPYSRTECSLHRFTPAVGSPQPPIQRLLGGLYPGLKRPGRQSNQSPPSSVKVKNAWRYTSTPCVFMAWCVIKCKENFTWTFCHCYCTITWSAYRPVDFLYGAAQKRVREFCEEGRNLNVLPLIIAD